MPCLHPNGVLGLSVKESVFNGTNEGFPEVIRCELQIVGEEVDVLAHRSMCASSTSEYTPCSYNPQSMRTDRDLALFSAISRK